MLEKVKTNYLLSLIIVICIVNIFVLTYVDDPKIVELVIYVSLSTISAISILACVKNMQKKKIIIML